VHNPTGDLLGAIAAWGAYRALVDPADIAARAERAALQSLRHGITAIRTHVDVGPDVGLRAAEAVLQVRNRLAPLLDIQVVALVAPPLTGLAGSNQRARLRDALDLGVDVVGGVPHIDPDPRGALVELVGTAAERRAQIDLHTDETL